MNNSPNNEFDGYVSVDTAPRNSICESKNCGKAAAHRYLVTGGIFHGNNGLFCSTCGERYTNHIERMSREAQMSAEPILVSYKWVYQRVHDGTLHEQSVCKAAQVQPLERYEEVIGTLRDEEVSQIPERHGGEIENPEDYNRWVDPTFPQ